MSEVEEKDYPKLKRVIRIAKKDTPEKETELLAIINALKKEFQQYKEETTRRIVLGEALDIKYRDDTEKRMQQLEKRLAVQEENSKCVDMNLDRIFDFVNTPPPRVPPYTSH